MFLKQCLADNGETLLRMYKIALRPFLTACIVCAVITPLLRTPFFSLLMKNIKPPRMTNKIWPLVVAEMFNQAQGQLRTTGIPHEATGDSG